MEWFLKKEVCLMYAYAWLDTGFIGSTGNRISLTNSQKAMLRTYGKQFLCDKLDVILFARNHDLSVFLPEGSEFSSLNEVMTANQRQYLVYLQKQTGVFLPDAVFITFGRFYHNVLAISDYSASRIFSEEEKSICVATLAFHLLLDDSLPYLFGSVVDFEEFYSYNGIPIVPKEIGDSYEEGEMDDEEYCLIYDSNLEEAFMEDCDKNQINETSRCYETILKVRDNMAEHRKDGIENRLEWDGCYRTFLELLDYLHLEPTWENVEKFMYLMGLYKCPDDFSFRKTMSGDEKEQVIAQIRDVYDTRYAYPGADEDNMHPIKMVSITNEPYFWQDADLLKKIKDETGNQKLYAVNDAVNNKTYIGLAKNSVEPGCHISMLSDSMCFQMRLNELSGMLYEKNGGEQDYVVRETHQPDAEVAG